MIKMYEGIPFSPSAELSQSLGATDTVIPVSNPACFPPAPNYATIGIDENAETVLYTQKTATALSGCTRGVEGVAKNWEQGELIARNFTNKDYQNLMDNINNKVDKDKIVNPNLLVNGDFKIWQRGTIFETSDGKYTADRWITSVWSHISKSNNGLLIKGNLIDGIGGISQIITREEIGDISGKLTFSCFIKSFLTFHLDIDIDGIVLKNLIFENINFTKESVTFDVPPNFKKIKIILRGGRMGVVSTNLAELEWCKLEVGEIATAFVPKLYGEELALCQRYYSLHNITSPIMASNPNSKGTYNWMVAVNKTYPATMRILPTIRVLYPFTIAGIGANISPSTYGGCYQSIEGMNYLEIEQPTVANTGNYVNALQFEADAEIY